MKIALVTEYFYPASKGGTEKYVYLQAKKITESGNSVIVITISENGVINFTYEEIQVFTISHENSGNKQIISGEKPSNNIVEFENLLEEFRPDVVHFNTLTPSFGIFHIELAKQFNCKVLFTAHTPGITCIRGDLMQYGKYACDGKIEKQKCLSCYCNQKGIPELFSGVTAKFISTFGFSSQLLNIVSHKYGTLKRLNFVCDNIYVFTKWQEKIFKDNGFDHSKLIVTSQMQIAPKYEIREKFVGEKVKIGFIGRLVKEKGLHLLIKALKNIKTENIELHIAGIIASEKDNYGSKLKQATAQTKNIFWQYNLNEVELTNFYKDIDILCIPSIWYETGPYVLYEALQNNIPIIANNLGDMQIWKNKGFDITLYNDLIGLQKILLSINNGKL